MSTEFQTRDLIETLPGGGWHTVRRLYLDDPGVRLAICPNCGNKDQTKFNTVVEGTVFKGLVCMACTIRPTPERHAQ